MRVAMNSKGLASRLASVVCLSIWTFPSPVNCFWKKCLSGCICCVHPALPWSRPLLALKAFRFHHITAFVFLYKKRQNGNGQFVQTQPGLSGNYNGLLHHISLVYIVAIYTTLGELRRGFPVVRARPVKIMEHGVGMFLNACHQGGVMPLVTRLLGYQLPIPSLDQKSFFKNLRIHMDWCLTYQHDKVIPFWKITQTFEPMKGCQNNKTKTATDLPTDVMWLTRGLVARVMMDIQDQFLAR